MFLSTVAPCIVYSRKVVMKAATVLFLCQLSLSVLAEWPLALLQYACHVYLSSAMRRGNTTDVMFPYFSGEQILACHVESICFVYHFDEGPPAPPAVRPAVPFARSLHSLRWRRMSFVPAATTAPSRKYALNLPLLPNEDSRTPACETTNHA